MFVYLVFFREVPDAPNGPAWVYGVFDAETKASAYVDSHCGNSKAKQRRFSVQKRLVQ